MKGQIYSSHHDDRQARSIRLSENGSFSYYSLLLFSNTSLPFQLEWCPYFPKHSIFTFDIGSKI